MMIMCDFCIDLDPDLRSKAEDDDSAKLYRLDRFDPLSDHLDPMSDDDRVINPAELGEGVYDDWDEDQ